jgi:glyoxylase-like metal-dependent hydrolase (beta-lactamase superfamily II)
MKCIHTTRALAKRLSEHFYLYPDCCNVYILASDQQVVLVDFGSGDVLDWIASAGLGQVTDVLITHHHRDQVQGLSRAVETGARIWVPEAEQDFFTHAEAFWQGREVFNNYNTRQDRFSILQDVPISGVLRDYETNDYGPWSLTIIPTPGHTPGSITLLAEIDGGLSAFTGDLIAGQGKLWSMAATQWTYNGCEGMAATLASLLDLQKRTIGTLYPSHGEVLLEPSKAIDLLAERIRQLLASREEYAWLGSDAACPYTQVSPHVLHNLHSESDSYVLLSKTGNALIFDFGYDFNLGTPAGFDRGARRPWLYTLDALKSQYGVRNVEAAIPTHYHDDHIAGLNLLQRVEGTQVWASSSIAGIIQDPRRWDLPCLWYDPIRVDRILPVAEPFRWQEYELTLYPLAGHTHYAVAIFFEADGKRYLVTGDQYQYGIPPYLNYVYQNRFNVGDYRDSAGLLRRLKPDLLLTGHWGPQSLPLEELDNLEMRGLELDLLHHDLLADEIQGLGAAGIVARIEPYQAKILAGHSAEFEVEVTNPYPHPEHAHLVFSGPAGWSVDTAELDVWMSACSTSRVSFWVNPPEGSVCRRSRLVVDVTIGEQRFGQVAEALVDVS